jgi:hypothetical protein
MPPRNSETVQVSTIQIAVPMPMPFAVAAALYGSNALKPTARPATYMSDAMPVATNQPPMIAPHRIVAYGCVSTTVVVAVCRCSIVTPLIADR